MNIKAAVKRYLPIAFMSAVPAHRAMAAGGLSVPTDLSVGVTTSGEPRMALTVDSDNFIWIVNAKSGSTWRGRINRLGWKKEQTDFIE